MRLDVRMNLDKDADVTGIFGLSQMTRKYGSS